MKSKKDRVGVAAQLPMREQIPKLPEFLGTGGPVLIVPWGATSAATLPGYRWCHLASIIGQMAGDCNSACLMRRVALSATEYDQY